MPNSSFQHDREGDGKEKEENKSAYIGRFIHNFSLRKEKPFYFLP